MTDKQVVRIKDKDIFTVPEVAIILGVSEYTVRETYIDGGNGKLKAFKPGNGTNKKGSKRRWRIWQKDLIEFLNRDSNIKEGE